MAWKKQQLQRREWKWIAWKYRLSAKLQDESSIVRARKAAQIFQRLSDLFIDDIPVRDSPQSNIGPQQLSHSYICRRPLWHFAGEHICRRSRSMFIAFYLMQANVLIPRVVCVPQMFQNCSLPIKFFGEKWRA